jgi:hypothetical protein
VSKTLTLTLNKALRMKNTLGKTQRDLFERVAKYNSQPVSTNRPYDVRATLEEHSRVLVDIVALKMAIFKANAEVQQDIFEMAEIKGNLVQLRSMNTRDGLQVNDYNESQIEYKAIVGQLELDELIKAAQKRIDDLQEKLDHFNAKKLIDVEFFSQID